MEVKAELRRKVRYPKGEPSRGSERAAESLPVEGVAGSQGVEDRELSLLINEYAGGLLERMGFAAEVETVYSDGAYEVRIAGSDNDAILIGRRGETLEAMQHVISKMASRGKEDLVRVRVDVSDYRARRNEQLADRARSMAEKVRETGHEVVTEPLAAAERRIIHRTLADLPDVTTHALGDGLVKRVWIGPTTAQGRNGDDGPIVEKALVWQGDSETIDTEEMERDQAVGEPSVPAGHQEPQSVLDPWGSTPQQETPREAPEWGRRPKPAKGRRLR